MSPSFVLQFFLLETIKLLAVHDFDPTQMNFRKKREFIDFCKRFEETEEEDVEYDEEVHDFEECLNEFGLSSLSMQDKQINREDEQKILKVKVYSRREETSDIQDQDGAVKLEELKTVKREKEFMTDKADLQHPSEENESLNKFGRSSQSRQDKQFNWENDLTALRVKAYSRRVETSDIEDREEEVKMEARKTVMQQNYLRFGIKMEVGFGIGKGIGKEIGPRIGTEIGE